VKSTDLMVSINQNGATGLVLPMAGRGESYVLSDSNKSHPLRQNLVDSIALTDACTGFSDL
jgi:hypothetical protein